MQDCFRKYPEVYGSELVDDEDEEAAPAQEVAKEINGGEIKSEEVKGEEVKGEEVKGEEVKGEKGKGEEAPAQSKKEVIPHKAHDATEANENASEEKKQ